MIDVHVPKMGMSTVEVDIVEVFVEVGDRVGAEDDVAEIEAEKAKYAVPAGVAGIVRELLVEAGDVCQVGDVLMRIEADAS